MGDRANCIVLQNTYRTDPPVWLYTHWTGYRLLADVQEAIKRGKSRWNDESYLTRIIFDSMTVGQHGELTSFGITTSETDNEHHFVVVDPREQQVRIEDCNTRKTLHKWSFADFCEADISKIEY